MTAHVKADSAPDFLAVLPSIVGFRPRESLVIVPFNGGRSCGCLRLDLPSGSSRSVHKRLASYAMGTICKMPGTTAVAIAVITESPIADGVAPHSALANVVSQRFRQSGFGIKSLLCHASNGWTHYNDLCIPSTGFPLSEVSESRALATVPDELVPSGEELPARIPDDDHRDSFSEDMVRFGGAGVDLPDPAYFAEEALSWSHDEEVEKGSLLLFAIQAPSTRDNVMLQWATDFRTGCAVFDWPIDPYASSVASTMWNVYLTDLMFGVGPSPDLERLDRGIRLLEVLVARAEDQYRPAPLCMLTWLEWARGNGTRAHRHLSEAIAIDPEYGMAEVLAMMLNRATLPEWAFSRGEGDAEP